jgi:hypothetical protein
MMEGVYSVSAKQREMAARVAGLIIALHFRDTGHADDARN